ncbi:MAG TPA: hypothetical protein VF092_17715 [Longimicrobium sp.]
MARVNMSVEKLEVQSFSTSDSGGTAVLDAPRREEKRKGNAIVAGDYSDMLGNTAWCDTDRDCSGVCLVATNVCYAC